MLGYNFCLILVDLSNLFILVCCDALFPAKSIVLPNPYSAILRRLRYLIVIFVGPFAIFPFFSDSVDCVDVFLI